MTSLNYTENMHSSQSENRALAKNIFEKQICIFILQAEIKIRSAEIISNLLPSVEMVAFLNGSDQVVNPVLI